MRTSYFVIELLLVCHQYVLFWNDTCKGEDTVYKKNIVFLQNSQKNPHEIA